MPALAASILTYLTAPGRSALVAGNVVFAVLVAGLFPLAGSGVGAAVIVTMVWGALLLAARRLPLPRARHVWLASGAFALFFLTEALTVALSGFAGDGLQEIAENLPFLGMLPLFALTMIPAGRLVRVLFLGASGGALLAAAAAPVFMMTHVPGRLELMTGNPLVLGLVASVMYGLALAGTLHLAGRQRLVCLAGALAAALLVVLSESRIDWIALLLMPFAMAALHIRSGRTRLMVFGSLIVLTGGAAMLAYQSVPVIQARVAAVSSDLEKARHDDLNTSLGKRFVLWDSAAALIRAHPVFGYGGGDIARLMAENDARVENFSFTFSHYHNAILNALVRGGIVNLAGFLAAFLTPLVLLWRNRHGEHGQAALAAGISLYIPYSLSGATGLVFGHDIHDAFFIGLSMLCLHASFAESDTA